VIGAGLRVAAVSNVSLVSVASLLGVAQLGTLFTEGSQLNSLTPILLGLIMIVRAGAALRRRHPGRHAVPDALAAGGAIVIALASSDNGLDFGRVSVWLNDPANWWGRTACSSTCASTSTTRSSRSSSR